MASLGHIAVGVATARAEHADAGAGRPPFSAMLFWAALSFLPDADVIGFGFGVRYGDEWGHRGASHSLMFALILGTVIGLLAPRYRRARFRTGIIAVLVLASHGVLDTFTNGGLGIAVFWPFDQTRYFAPWTPIPVSPIGLGYLSPYGLRVAATELVLFAPLLWYAWRPRTAQFISSASSRAGRVTMIAIWVAAAWVLLSGLGG
jgi:inner membrane protein